jgi:hypothetical protein
MSAAQLQLFEVEPAPGPKPLLIGEQLIQRCTNPALAARFRTWATGLEAKIEHAGRPMTQNPTPKRNCQYQSRMIDCRNLERLQKALLVLAAGHEDGSISLLLSLYRTKDEIGRLVHKSVDSSKGGYYSCIECDDYRDKSPSARLLQGLIDGNPAQCAERLRLHQIGELQAAIALSNIPGFFPTPPAVVEVMLRRAHLYDRMMVLEPSAGSGNIADAIKAAYPSATIHAIEPNLKLRELLTLKGHALVGSDLLETNSVPIYDRIVMNPPFEKQADIDHVRKAFEQLRSDGILVSVMSPSFEFRADRKSTEFRTWLEAIGAYWEDLPNGSFKSSGTGVATRMLVIEKPAEVA